MLLPHGQQGAEAGQRVSVRMFRTREEVDRTIFAIGSHDMALDLLAQFLAEHNRRLVSANVGSLGGLVALKRGEAHLAGSHLLDPETGEYNLSYIRQYLAGEPVSLYAFVKREQGLIVPKENPKELRGLGDLIRENVTFVNRQRGAGTRVLLDYHLNRLGIAPEQVSGYNQEEYTHLGVAAAVASGRADCGLGIPAAAQALELDFVPLFDEEYQLVIPKRYADDRLFVPFFEVIASRAFQAAVAGMPGYGVGQMSQLIAEV
jgi:putative molybdopterin biosynthesis protein